MQPRCCWELKQPHSCSSQPAHELQSSFAPCPPSDLSLTLPSSRALLLLRVGTVHHFNGAQTPFAVTLTHPGRGKKKGAAQGSRTWGFPCSPGQDGGQVCRRLTLTAGVRFPRGLVGTHLQRAQHRRGFGKPSPQGDNPTIQNATYILPPTHTEAYIFPPQQGERYTSVILFDFSC